MNSIHLPIDTRYTILGYPRSSSTPDPGPAVSLVLLVAEARYQLREILESFASSQWWEILVVMSGPADTELAQNLPPGMRLLSFLANELNTGSMVNIALREATAPLVYVVTTFMKPQMLTSRQMEAALDPETAAVAPACRNQRNQLIPTVSVPSQFRDELKVLQLAPSAEHRVTLFPWNFVAVYQRAAFLSLGGFDDSIRNPYWQVMDFGLRAWLWGYHILVDSALRLSVDTDPPVVEETADLDALICYLKNLAVEFDADHGHVEKKVFWEILSRSGPGFFATRRIFKKVLAWVEANKFRFRMDAKNLVELWGEDLS